MTIREKLADWISGGALTKARAHKDEVWGWFAKLENDMGDIANATASGKSGTAKKIHRMATEALK